MLGFIGLIDPRCQMVFHDHLCKKLSLPKAKRKTICIELMVFEGNGIRATYNGRCIYHAKENTLKRLFHNDEIRRIDGMIKVATSRIARLANADHD